MDSEAGGFEAFPEKWNYVKYLQSFLGWAAIYKSWGLFFFKNSWAEKHGKYLSGRKSLAQFIHQPDEPPRTFSWLRFWVAYTLHPPKYVNFSSTWFMLGLSEWIKISWHLRATLKLYVIGSYAHADRQGWKNILMVNWQNNPLMKPWCFDPRSLVLSASLSKKSLILPQGHPSLCPKSRVES